MADKLTQLEIPLPLKEQGTFGRTRQPHTHTTDILERIKKAGDGFLFRVWVDDAMAADLLDLNFGNREFKYKDIKQYAEDMYADDFKYTGDSFRVSDIDRLIDGQKRLWGLRVANEKRLENKKPPVKIEVNIVTGIPDKNRLYLDLGVNRDAPQVLKDQVNAKDPNNLAAAIRHIWYLTQYHRVAHTMPKGEKLRNPKMVQWAKYKNRYKAVEALIPKARAIHKDGPFVTISMYAALWYLFQTTDPDFADVFMVKLGNGEDLHMSKVVDNNITYLRQKLNRIILKKVDNVHLFRGDQRVKNIIHCWNACRQGIRLAKDYPIDVKSYDIEEPI